MVTPYPNDNCDDSVCPALDPVTGAGFPNYFAMYGRKLAEGGHHVCPARPGRKTPGDFYGGRWHGMTQWERFSERLPTDLEMDLWEKWPGAGVCLLLPDKFVIDFDVADVELADSFRRRLVDRFGDTIMKVGNAPKFSAIYRTDERILPVKSSFPIEGLGYGNQTVLYAVHPDTGRPYGYPYGDELTDVPHDELPVVTEEAVRTFLAEEYERLPLVHRVSRVRARADAYHVRTGDRDLRGTVPAITDAYKFLPNEDVPYPEWIDTGMATKAAIGEDGFVLWDNWSKKSAKNETKGYNNRETWDSLKPTRIGAGSIYHLAMEHGWTPPPGVYLNPWDEECADLAATPEFREMVNALLANALSKEAAQEAQEAQDEAETATVAENEENRSTADSTPLATISADPAALAARIRASEEEARLLEERRLWELGHPEEVRQRREMAVAELAELTRKHELERAREAAERKGSMDTRSRESARTREMFLADYEVKLTAAIEAEIDDDPDPVQDHDDPAAKAFDDAHIFEYLPRPDSRVDRFKPGGTLERCHREILDKSEVRQPELALPASIVLNGLMASRRYVGPTDLGTNFYACGLARTGDGKDFPMKFIGKVVVKLGLDRLLGGSSITSDSAIESTIAASPVTLFTIDELGLTIEAMLKEKNPSSPIKAAVSALLKLSSAEGFYVGKKWANQKAVTGQTDSRKIVKPHVSILGYSTESTVWNALTKASATSGLLGRWMFFSAPKDIPTERVKRPPTRKRRKAGDRHPSEALLAVLRAVHEGPAGWDFGEFVDVAECDCFQFPVGMTYRAEDWLEDLVYAQRSLRDSLPDDSAVADIFNRTAEMTHKLALLHAISRSANCPIISLQSVRWAYAVALNCNRLMAHRVDTRVAASEFERGLQAIKATLGSARGKMKRRDVQRQNPLQNFKLLLDHLLMSEEVIATLEHDKTTKRDTQYLQLNKSK